jgi:AraC-like DNA-binding protein
MAMMNWAAERLRSSPILIRQVAEELNLDPFQFSRTFKRVQGLSPSEFLAGRGSDHRRQARRT